MIGSDHDLTLAFGLKCLANKRRGSGCQLSRGIFVRITRQHQGELPSPPRHPRIKSGEGPTAAGAVSGVLDACFRGCREIGWSEALRASRRTLRVLLSMREVSDGIKQNPHPEEAA